MKESRQFAWSADVFERLAECFDANSNIVFVHPAHVPDAHDRVGQMTLPAGDGDVVIAFHEFDYLPSDTPSGG